MPSREILARYAGPLLLATAGGLLPAACAATGSERQEPPEVVAVTVEKAASTVRALPANVQAARDEFPTRKRKIVESWVRNYAASEFAPWKSQSETTIAQLSAVAMLFAEPELWNGSVQDQVSRTALLVQVGGLQGFHQVIDERLLAPPTSQPPQSVLTIFPKTAIHQYTSVGTPGSDEEGDYDFTLLGSIALVHALAGKKDPASGSLILPRELVRRLLTHAKVTFQESAAGCAADGELPFSGQNVHDDLSVGQDGLPYLIEGGSAASLKIASSETENHVLNMYGWRYLAQNYLEWVAGLTEDHPNFDPCLTALFESDPERYRNETALTNFVVQILTRFLRYGAFETNAHPYEAVTLPPLLALAGHSTKFIQDPERGRVARAARNAMDFLATQYALQSFEGQRVSPRRRRWDDKRLVFGGDSTAAVFGVLSGAHLWDDSPTNACEHCPHYFAKVNLRGARALTAALSGYEIPEPVHDLMLDKHKGYFARMQSKYSTWHYPLHIGLSGDAVPDTPDPDPAEPIYDLIDNPTRASFRPVQELYFASKGFLNSGSGSANDYYPDVNCDSIQATINDVVDTGVVVACASSVPILPWVPLAEVVFGTSCWGLLNYLIEDDPGDVCSKLDKLRSYDSYTVPYTVIGSGTPFVDRDAATTWEELAVHPAAPLVMPSNGWWNRSNDTYKNFSYGFFNKVEQQTLPWVTYAAYRAFEPVEQGDAKFYFFDMSNADPHQPLVGHYVVLALLDDQPSPFETEVAGFWEVVPQSARFPTVTALRDAVLSDNPAENFPQLLPGGLGMSTGTFQYRMAMSGETLTIFRPQNVFRSSIIEIRAADGTEVPLTEHGFGHRSCNGGEPCEDDAFDLPLIDAWQVDCDYNFTGKVLAHAPGDGTLTVRNPYTAQILHIDSSDISNPTWSLEADPNNADYGPHSCESTPGCSVDSDCDAAANEFCDAGTCRTRPCNPASPFRSISEVLPGSTSTDGFALSADGRKAFFSRKAPGATNYDLYFAERPDTTSPFGQLQAVEGPVNSALDERAPFLSADQLRLYYWTKNTGNSNSDLKVATRTLPSGPFLSADVVGGVNNNVNSPVSDEDPYFIDGEGTLYFTSDRPTGERHIYVTTKQSNGLFSAPQPVQNLASYAEDRRPIVSRDGLTIFFGSQREGWNGDNDGDIFFSQRSNPGAEFQQPANLGALNHSGVDFPVALSADGCSLYFASNRRHGASGTQTFELYQAHRQTEPSSVTIVMNVTGTGTGSVLAPYSCAIGGSGTCAVTRPFGTLLTINATRPAYWSGACVANGQPGLSTDGVVQYDLGGTCNVTFPPP